MANLKMLVHAIVRIVVRHLAELLPPMQSFLILIHSIGNKERLIFKTTNPNKDGGFLFVKHAERHYVEPIYERYMV